MPAPAGRLSSSAFQAVWWTRAWPQRWETGNFFSASESAVMPAGPTGVSLPKPSSCQSGASQSAWARPVGSPAGTPVSVSSGRRLRRSRQSGFRYSQLRSASSRTERDDGRP